MFATEHVACIFLEVPGSISGSNLLTLTCSLLLTAPIFNARKTARLIFYA